MWRLLVPSLCLASIFQINLEGLRQRGICGLILDLDNTLVAWGGDPEEKLFAWLRQVREAGMAVCIVSNNDRARVKGFSDLAGIPAIPRARKPRRRAFRAAMQVMGTAPEETAVVGDQIFTDILGGNRLGLYTILVTPVARREFVGTRLVRLLEKLVLIGLQKRTGPGT